MLTSFLDPVFQMFSNTPSPHITLGCSSSHIKPKKTRRRNNSCVIFQQIDILNPCKQSKIQYVVRRINVKLIVKMLKNVLRVEYFVEKKLISAI